MLPTYHKFPDTILIGGEYYKIILCKKLTSRGKDCLGLCNTNEKIIYLRIGRPHAELFSTLIHEVLHAFEFEYSVPLRHNQVYRLEQAIADFFTANLSAFVK